MTQHEYGCHVFGHKSTPVNRLYAELTNVYGIYT